MRTLPGFHKTAAEFIQKGGEASHYEMLVTWNYVFVAMSIIVAQNLICFILVRHTNNFVLVVCICCRCFVFIVFVNCICNMFFIFFLLFVYFTCCVLLNVLILSVVLL
jgi:hypothetical protein